MQASRQLESYEKNGFGNLPMCMAKTHLSISSDPALERGAHGLEAAGAGGSGVGGGGVHLPDLRRHEDHAGSPVATRPPSA